MKRHCAKHGFTLVELLTVIAIISVLAAILFPVFSSAREKARQTRCQSNLSQLAIALKAYRLDHGKYPPAPIYVSSIPRYIGGFSSLYPDYVDDKNLFICPNDRDIDMARQAAMDRVYCSYNGLVSAPDASDESTWEFDTNTDGPICWYNYYGYNNSGVDPYDDSSYPYPDSTPDWLKDAGLKYRHYPRLMNRQAPDNTILTHCTHHRGWYRNDTDEKDIVLRLTGKTKVINRMSWQVPGSGGVSKFVTQRD